MYLALSSSNSQNRYCADVSYSLPTELWDTVIDYVGDPFDRNYGLRMRDLRACALTCRAWLERSRRNLFRFLKIEDPADVDKVTKALKRFPNHARDVRHLDIFGDSSVESYTQLLVELSFLIPTVETMEFCNVSLRNLTRDAANAMSNFIHLRQLSFDEVLFDNLAQLAAFLQSLQSLSRLALSGVMLSEDLQEQSQQTSEESTSVEIVPKQASLPKLISVQVFHDYLVPTPAAIHYWLSETSASSYLTSFTHCGRRLDFKSGNDQATAVSALLHKRGAKLQQLRFDSYLLESDTGIHIGLQSCTSLEALSISDISKDGFSYLNFALQHIRSTSLSRLSFTFRWEPEFANADFIQHWHQFDNTLSSGVFQNVDQISIYYQGQYLRHLDGVVDEFTETLSRCLPRTSGRGVVRIMGWEEH